MKYLIYFTCKTSNFLTLILNGCAAVAALAIRLYIFKVFFWSGMLKLTSWSATLALFEHQYKVQWVTPYTAAVLSTAAEIIFPIFLLLGLGARVPSLGLLIFTILNVLFYPQLLKPEYACMLKDQVLLGVLISITALYGHGIPSVDYWLQQKICKDYKY